MTLYDYLRIHYPDFDENYIEFRKLSGLLYSPSYNHTGLVIEFNGVIYSLHPKDNHSYVAFKDEEDRYISDDIYTKEVKVIKTPVRDDSFLLNQL